MRPRHEDRFELTLGASHMSAKMGTRFKAPAPRRPASTVKALPPPKDDDSHSPFFWPAVLFGVSACLLTLLIGSLAS